ncbi:uncharacterized protein LOC123552334 isoform X2 [Mercenaria mercenaria]|uniref:uncharacterized protein LOC123552334 isoform X2 n=1 Tax=Mercenaria mercenaria TaxID=6596 RepID=UPI00234F2C9D|nr:uncharacterized protein LOC123552334 isoform X2 [Mercenaria mercenaria]
MDCVEVVENLSQREKNSILHVLQRDEQLRQGQEEKISNLKREINLIRMCSVLRAGDDQSKICLRCRTEMGILFNRGSLCPSCKYKVCKSCQEVMFNGSWLCKLCYKQRQLKWLTGEWTASFEQNPLRKWASGSDLVKASLQMVPGTTSIDIDESPSNHGNNKQGKKVSRNGVGGADQGRTRVEVPKEGDQLKLSELFNVLRVKKPEDKVIQETQVRRITSRKYSESDSDSSSNSDIDIKSTSTAPSVTESELDGRRIESPRGLESPPPQIVEPPMVARVHKTAERYPTVKKIESPEYRVEDEAYRPKPSPRSPKPAARRKVKSENLEQENITPMARPRTKERRSDGTERVVEGQVSMSRSMEVRSSAGRSANENELSDKGSVHSELNLHVAKTKESLDKKSRSQVSLDSRRLESDSSVRPKSKEQIVRKSADSLSLESKQTMNTDQRSLHKSDNQLDRKNGADIENKRNDKRRDVIIKSSSSSREPILVDESQMSVNQKDIDTFSDRSIPSKHSIDKEQSKVLTTSEEEGLTQRTGSPYSFSMDSLPSSHPSPTLNRCSFSSNPDSDTDSVSRLKGRPDPILEQSPSSSRSAKTVPKGENKKEDIVVEEISKVQFRRVSKTVGQLGSIAKMSLSPNRNNTPEVDLVVEQRETQSRVGSGLREEGGGSQSQNLNTFHKMEGVDSVFYEDPSSPVELPAAEEDLCIKQDVSARSPPNLVTELLMKKLESKYASRNGNETSRLENKSTEEMAWIHEDESRSHQVKGLENKSLKRLPKLMTSSVTSEYDRKPSEADSIEDMIDNMARAHLYVETNVPPRASESDSDVGFTLTPVTPFPQEMYEKRSGKYNRFAYISDDNLDGDSADDLLGDENDEMEGPNRFIEKENKYLETESKLPDKKKIELRSMDSLDLILINQEDYVDGSQPVIELETEYQNALKFSNEKNEDIRAAEKSTVEPREGEMVDIPDKVTTENSVEIDDLTSKNAVDLSGEMKHDKESKHESIDSQVSEKEPIILKKMKRKPKLETENSLDILLDQQGDLVDQNSQNFDFDAELLANLENNLKEHLSAQKRSPTLGQEYAYLGIQHVVKASSDENSQGKASPNQDDFDTLVEGAREYLDGKTENTTSGCEPILKVKNYIKHDTSPESSDSDMLSVIEEVDDERSESDDGDKEDTKERCEVERHSHSLQNVVRIDNTSIVKTAEKERKPEISEAVIGKDIVIENKSSVSARKHEEDENKTKIKGKIFQKARDIEQRVKNLTKGIVSSAAVTSKKGSMKHKDKYKKVHDCWLALERHEADMLDIDEFDKDTEAQQYTEEHKGKSDVNDETTDVRDELKEVESNYAESFGIDTDMESKSNLENVLSNPESNEITEEDMFESVSIIRETNKFGIKMDTENQDNVKTESDSPDSSAIHDILKDEGQTGQVILNSTVNDKSNYSGASLNDSNIFCHTISDISSLAETELPDSSFISKQSVAADASLEKGITSTTDSCQSLQEIKLEQTQEVIKQEESFNLKISINDSKGLCQSISELQDPVIESLSDLEHPSSSFTSEQSLTDDSSHQKSITAPRDSCHSLPDIDKEKIQEVTGEKESFDLKTSINDSRGLCQSISERQDPIIESLSVSEFPDIRFTSKQSMSKDAGLKESITAPTDSCQSLQDIKIEETDEVIKQEESFDLKTSINDSKGLCQSISELKEPFIESVTGDTSLCVDVTGDVFVTEVTDHTTKDTTKDGTNKERLDSDEIRIEIKSMQQSQKSYKTEIELNLDRSGKVTPPASTTKDPKFFRPPEKPPRVKKETSSSSGLDSPEISPVNPQVYMDSDRTEKLASARDSSRESPRTLSECSVSQDDSGNVSGGSRGTTPEHRRTDSSYSQSSLPSTLSNVTDDSRESLASYYSDAGDIAYSNIPITGEILFSLNYNYKTNMLEVGVKQCRNIAVADTRRRRSDPYVKTYLLPDRTRGGKRKTKVKKHSTSPTFDETLKYSLTKSELENRTLWLTVWHNDRFGRNVFLGEVTINFDYYKFEDPFPKWYPLQERMDAPPPSMMVYKGDLSLCVRFVPAEKIGASPAASSKQKKDSGKGSGKGQLEVMMKEARNLTAVRSNGFSDPFCKGYLLPERHKSSKQKTAVIKKDCSPVWNHTFVFEDVTLMELRERCLELTIWDYEKLASNDFLGGVRLNLGTGVSGGKAVDWMDARGEEMSMWQAMLDRPNVWIDGALILRPNMDKRKF